MKIRIVYGNVIATARRDKGLTLRQAAERAHISFNYFHEVEKGKTEASSEYLGAILRSLDLSHGEFFTRVANEYRRAA